MTDTSLYIFDMDGVILDSLDKLSKCLIESVKPFCQSDSHFQQFSQFDVANPGLSRFEKVDYFVSQLPTSNHLNAEQVKIEILQRFQRLSLEARLSSNIENEFYDLPGIIPSKNLLLLSNCDNDQLKVVDAHFGFHQIFKGGIIGTPPSKRERLSEVLRAFDNLSAISVSDSESDAVIARDLGVSFVFIQRFARDSAPWLNENEFRFSTLNDFKSKLI